MAEARVVKVVPNRDLHIAEALVWRDGIRIALELHANGSSQRHYLDYRAAMRFAIDLQAPPELPYILEDGFPLWYGYQRDGIMEVRLTGGDEARPRGTVILHLNREMAEDLSQEIRALVHEMQVGDL